MTKSKNDFTNEEHPMINRSAIVLELTEVYLEWARKCPDSDPDFTLEEAFEDGTVYLIPEVYTEPEKWLKRNYRIMFEHELYAWYTDDTCWPKDRSFEEFKKFFKIRFCSIVLDLCNGLIEREYE